MIETERLVIRLPETADVPEIIRYYRDNLEFLRPYSPSFSSDILDERTWVEQVAWRRQEFKDGYGLRCFLFPRDRPQQVAGNINVTQVQRGPAQSCVLGYNLAELEQGKGYMTEAVVAVVRFAFDRWGLHRVAASHMPRNERSAAVLHRCGFEVEGLARDYLMIDGRWEDHVLNAIRKPV